MTAPKRESILLRAEPGTKAAMQAKADMAGLSVAEWHRRVVMAALNGGTIERAALRTAPVAPRTSADAKAGVRPRPKGGAK